MSDSLYICFSLYLCSASSLDELFLNLQVLKSRGLIDMQQDRPYGDIALKLMPALFSKVQT